MNSGGLRLLPSSFFSHSQVFVKAIFSPKLQFMEKYVIWNWLVQRWRLVTAELLPSPKYKIQKKTNIKRILKKEVKGGEEMIDASLSMGVQARFAVGKTSLGLG